MELVDVVCNVLGMTRSELVRAALSEHVHEYTHVLRGHECVGVVVAYGDRCVGDWRGLARTYMCAEVSGLKVSVAIVEGGSADVAELVGRLSRDGLEARYVPIR